MAKKIGRTIYSGGEIDCRISAALLNQRQELVDWLLGEIPHPELTQPTMPRFVMLSKESLRLYADTGDKEVLSYGADQQRRTNGKNTG
jgi:hypothetical protein